MTYKLAHISDTHVCETARIQDLSLVLDAFLNDAADEGVDLIVHGGDFYDKRSTPSERIVLASFLQQAAELAPVFGVKGNHDAAGDMEIFNNRLKTHWPVTVVDRPTMIGGAHVYGRFACLGLPWFDKAHLVSALPPTANTDETREAVNAAAGDLLIGLKAEAERVRGGGLIPILASHAMVEGSVMSSGQTIQGTTVALSPHALLEVGAEYVALGHVHAAQEWFEGRICYSGSPIRHNFGEPEAKGWRLVTFDEDGHFLRSEFRPLPAREIVLLEADFRDTTDRSFVIAGSVGAKEAPKIAGALVRLRYKCRPQDLTAIDDSALENLLREAGAVDVKLEAVVEHADRVRSETITRATTTKDKVHAYFEAKGLVLTPEERARLDAKVDDLDREV